MAINWTPELEDSICSQLLDGKSMRQICSQKGFPDRITVIRYMDRNQDFAAKCARARDEQADLMDDRILEVAQKVEDGQLEPKAGSVVISALQWRASKLKPKKYGDKIQQEITGELGIKTVVVVGQPKDTQKPELKPSFTPELTSGAD